MKRKRRTTRTGLIPLRPRPTKHTDRISALPEPIVHHILSFLPNKDVKVTTSLSKTWYHICTSFPFLDFHLSDDYGFVPCIKDIDKYLNHVEQTLRKFHDLNLQIQRFTLPIVLHFPKVALVLDTWISLVLQHGIQELNLDIRNTGQKFPILWYDVPGAVFVAKSIKVAKLAECSLLQSFPNISGSSSNLLKLHLNHVLLDDLSLSSIGSTCPLIEELFVLSCLDIKRLRISNLNQLKTLRISHAFKHGAIEMVEINAPGLQSLDVCGSVKIRALDCPKLTHLDLDYVALDNDFRLQDFLSRLSFLSSLRLANILSLIEIDISSGTLNKIRVYKCRGLVELMINAPNLLSFEYNFEYFSLVSSSSIDKVICQWNGCLDGYAGRVNPIKVEHVLGVLRNFVSYGKHLRSLYLHLQNIHEPIGLEKLNKRDAFPVGNIDQLELQVINGGSEIRYPDLLDCVLWSCQPRTLSLRLDRNDLRNDNNNTVMCIHKAITRRRTRFWPMKDARRWLSCLEDVKYVTEDGQEDRYFMEGDSYVGIKFMFKW